MIRTLASTFLISVVLAIAGALPAHSQEWQPVKGAARDVGVGANGSVWAVGKKAVPGGYKIMRRGQGGWVDVPGGAERIAVDPQGNAWIVNATQNILRFDAGNWVPVNGAARDIGIGANGTVWIIGNEVEAGGYGIHRSTDKGANWTKIPGSALRVSVDPQGNAWVVNNSNTIFRHDGSNWVSMPGSAIDVGVGADGVVWVVGTDNGIYRLENNAWVKKAGAAAQIAAGPNGSVWVVDPANLIQQASLPPPSVVIPVANINLIPVPPPAPTPPATPSDPNAVAWTLKDGAARDVGIGADGSVWVIGTNSVPGGYPIWRRVNNAWVNVPGGAERIAVDPQGNAWVVNNTQNIFRFDGAKWITLNGSARDIGVGANGTAWIIGNTPEAGGYAIYRSTDKGATWTKVAGSALRVSVDPQGYGWVVNKTNHIFRHDGNQWNLMPGSATDIGVGADGQVWVIGTNNGIYRWENNAWVQKPGGAAQIAAGPNGNVWVVNLGNQIYQAQVAAPAAAQVAGTTPVAVGPITYTGPSIPVSGPISPTGPADPTMPAPVPGVGPGLVVGGGVTPTGPGTGPIVVSGGPQTETLPGPVGTSQATCGVAGKGLCSNVSAQLVGNADVSCPSGSFADLGMSACYSCPSGYSRSGHAVTDFRACLKPDSSVKQAFMSATFKGPLCASGTFFDLYQGGGCYSCPSGYERSIAHISESWACLTPLESFKRATRHNNGLAWDCGSGTFWDGWDGGACWSCPSGYRRTAYHIADHNACVSTNKQEPAHASLVKKAECGPGEIKDAYVQGTQNPSYGGGCWTCPIGTARTALPIYGGSGCEREGGVTFAAATRVKGMTCEATEIFDPISSANPAMADALRSRNQRSPTVDQKTIGGTCWTCPAGHKRTGSAVYSGSACSPPGIVWQSAPFNQPGLFGMAGAEAVALKLVNERTTINSVIQGLIESGQAPANFAQLVWDEIATRPQDSAALSLAVFSRVVAAANNPSAATPEEKALLEDVVKYITKYRVFMAQDALDAYLAWKGGQGIRSSQYLQSQLQTITNIGEVPPDFDAITAGNIMGSLVAISAANTAIYFTMTSQRVFQALFPHATRSITQALIASSAQAGARLGGTALTAAVNAGVSSASIAASVGPQIIVTFGLIILQVAIEQQIAIAEAEPKLRANLTVAQNFRADFPRLMATTDGSAQAQSYWSTLVAGPAKRADGTRPSARGPLNQAAFAQAAMAAKQALVVQAGR